MVDIYFQIINNNIDMSGNITETVTKGFGSRILGSLQGIVIGIFLFVISFFVLFWNEGRLNLSSIAEDGEIITSVNDLNDDLDEELILLEGNLSSQEIARDEYIRDRNNLIIERKVEMYAWIEDKDEDTERNTGGSETTTVTYNYRQDWTSSPQNSQTFKEPEDHINPELQVRTSVDKVDTAVIDGVTIDMKSIKLPAQERLELTDSNVNQVNGFVIADQQYLFAGAGTTQNPQIGDVRISFTYLPNPLNGITAVGKYNANTNSISKYNGPDNSSLHRIFKGDAQNSIAKLQGEHTTMTWVLRVVGFLLMWIGLSLILGPISTFLDILPFLGSASRFIIGIITFAVALVLSIITIIIGIIVNNIFLLIGTLLLLGVGGYFIFKNKKKLKLPSKFAAKAQEVTKQNLASNTSQNQPTNNYQPQQQNQNPNPGVTQTTTNPTTPTPSPTQPNSKIDEDVLF